MKLSEILFESDVYRLDSSKIKDFSLGLRTYTHSPDWTESGLSGEDEEVPEGMQKSKVLFAVGDTQDVAPYMAPRDLPRIWTSDTIYFNKGDERSLRDHSAWLSMFDGDRFKYMSDSNEYVSDAPGKPLKQTQITDSVGFMEANGYKVKFVDDVIEQAKEFDEQGIEYNAEGL
jgi:hypothetical protein